MIGDTHPRVQARIDAIAATMPGASALEIDLRWSEVHYGRELTDRVRRWLSKRA